ncbi:MAG: GNAT family N-acetyltransferase [Anaerolineales bacterium]|nr:GNAT family N-acetyltransferase [Anaerolineales bacterium]
MDIQLRKAEYWQKAVLRNLMELYSYDFSVIEGDDVDEFGLFGYRYLDHYWTEAGRYPYLVKVDGVLVGFVLLREGTYFDQLAEEYPFPPMKVTEFFVLRKYRRKGVGRYVAREVFNRYPRRWEVAQVVNDVEAQAFWRRIIDEYTHGQFEEHFLNDANWHGPVLIFDNSL